MASSSNPLPLDLLRNILSHFNYKTLLKIQSVCKAWKAVIDENLANIPSDNSLAPQMFMKGVWICSELGQRGCCVSEAISAFERENIDTPEVAANFKESISTICTFMGKPNIDHFQEQEMTSLISEMMALITSKMTFIPDDDE